MNKLISFRTHLVLLVVFGATITACSNSDSSSEADKSSAPTAIPIESVPFGEPGDTGVIAIAQGYFHVKDALVQSDAKTAQAGATMIVKAIDPNESDESLQAIREDATYIASAKIVDQQRERFSALSEKVFVLLGESVSLPATVYRQYCPMAQENKGAYWISVSDQIRNPYFGDKMLKCGEVVATL